MRLRHQGTTPGSAFAHVLKGRIGIDGFARTHRAEPVREWQPVLAEQLVPGDVHFDVVVKRRRFLSAERR